MLEYILVGTAAVGGYVVWNSFGTFNRLMALDERCTTAFADVDALLKHRHDLIPGLLDIARNMVGQDNYIVDQVLIAFRETNTRQVEKRLMAEKNLGTTVGNLLSTLERLPRANQGSRFMDLREAFRDVENRITAARRFYNNTVEEHNSLLRQFPGNVIGAKFRLDQRRQYTLGAERVFKDEAVSLRM